MKVFLSVLVVIVVGVGLWLVLGSSGGVGGSFSSSGVTNTVVKVGLNASATSTVLTEGAVEYWAKICNNGVGNVTLCYAANCVYGSGITLATTTDDICHEIGEPNLYKGVISAAVSATTTPSTTSTLGIIYR